MGGEGKLGWNSSATFPTPSGSCHESPQLAGLCCPVLVAVGTESLSTPCSHSLHCALVLCTPSV